MSTTNLIGVMAAASMLGLHRSTLNLAIQRRDIIPDAFTPGGHARFKLETIEAYRAQVSDGPAASGARPRLTQLLTRKLAEAAEPRDLADLALKHLAKIIPGLTQAMVLVHKPEPANPWHVELLAAHGVRWQAAQRLGALRSTHEFAYLRVLREGTPIICRDTHNEQLATGTHAFVELSGLGAFLLLPLTFGERVCGVFELGFAAAREFPQPDEQFFLHIADLLAVAIWMDRQQREYHEYLETARTMMELGLQHRATPRDEGAARLERISGMLTALAQSYRSTTGAFTVICTAGPLAPTMVEDATVRGLAERCVRERRDVRQSWVLEGRTATAMAAPVPLAGGQMVGIAAGWKLPRVAWDEDLDLLRVVAGACVLGLSND